MSSRAKPLHEPAHSSHARALRRIFSLVGTAFVLSALGCSSDIQDNRTATSTGASGSNSASSGESSGMGGAGGFGGAGGNGASGGTGGAPIDGGSGPVEYLAFNLFTHVPRFVVMKVDHTRNLCFRIWVEGFTGPGTLNITVTDPWVTNRAEVTPDVNDCAVSMGFPAPPATYADATAGMGSMMVQGGFPCSINLHATITFNPIASWVPGSETFDVDGLNVDGGCG